MSPNMNDKTKNSGSSMSGLNGLVGSLRLLEADHTPDGWPAVKMAQISTALDALDVAMGYLAVMEDEIDDTC